MHRTLRLLKVFHSRVDNSFHRLVPSKTVPKHKFLARVRIDL